MRRTVFRPLVQRAAQYVYSRADGISHTPARCATRCIQLGARPGHVSIEYPGFNLEHFSPGPRDPELQRRYGLQPADRVVVFMGEFHYFSAAWLAGRGLRALPAGAPRREAAPARQQAERWAGPSAPDDIQRVGQRMGVSDAVKTPGRIEYQKNPAGAPAPGSTSRWCRCAPPCRPRDRAAPARPPCGTFWPAACSTVSARRCPGCSHRCCRARDAAGSAIGRSTTASSTRSATCWPTSRPARRAGAGGARHHRAAVRLGINLLHRGLRGRDRGHPPS